MLGAADRPGAGELRGPDDVDLGLGPERLEGPPLPQDGGAAKLGPVVPGAEAPTLLGVTNDPQTSHSDWYRKWGKGHFDARLSYCW